jgi:hypothetical protein
LRSQHDSSPVFGDEYQQEDYQSNRSFSQFPRYPSNKLLIQIIHSLIDINLGSLRSIINSIVGSMLPTINSGIQAGIPIPDNIQKLLAKFDISEIRAQTFLDFLAAGLIIDL